MRTPLLLAAGALMLAACGSDDALITLPDSEPEITALAIYISQDTAGGLVSVHVMDLETQEITEVNPALPADSGPFDVVVHPSGQYVYVLTNNDNTINGYEVDPNTGNLTELAGSGWASAGDPTALVMSPNGDFIFDMQSSFNDVGGLSIDSDTGELARDFTAQTTGFGVDGAVDPESEYFYGVNFSGGVYEFQIDAGSTELVPLGGTPHDPAGSGDYRAVLAHPDGGSLYLADDGNSEVHTLEIAGNGTVSDHANFADASGDNNPRELAIDPAGSFVYVSHSVSNKVGVFEVLGDGSLGEHPGSPMGPANAIAEMAVDPTGQYLMGVNGSGELSVLEIDPDTGALTELPDSPVTIPVGATGIAMLGLEEPAE